MNIGARRDTVPWTLTTRSPAVLQWRFKSVTVHNSEVTVARNVGRRSLPKSLVHHICYLAGVVEIIVWYPLRREIIFLATYQGNTRAA
jgi:hypothetical protein